MMKGGRGEAGVVFGTLMSLLTMIAAVPMTGSDKHEYCIVGSGPGGVQLAIFMEKGGVRSSRFALHFRCGTHPAWIARLLRQPARRMTTWCSRRDPKRACSSMCTLATAS